MLFSGDGLFGPLEVVKTGEMFGLALLLDTA